MYRNIEKRRLFFNIVIQCRESVNEEIYLFSVAFGKSEDDYERCPDRKTAISSADEIRQSFPDFTISLIKINISKERLNETRQAKIRHLLSPRFSVLDDSIGCALWFASHSTEGATCRLVLSGLGADELFCGYSCHRRIFDREGVEALGTEVQNQIERISERNCGRDDRVISDSGREYRNCVPNI